ncbi:MAG: M48 family metallopeptidase [Rhodospirillales bacterium]|nr:M48 family metallopeptidase [Rhodospirillales bacterium]
MRFAATYRDGVSAQGRPAVLFAEGRDLVIELEGGRRVRWPAAEVRDADPPEAARPGLRLRRLGSDERLSVADDEATAAIRAACPDLARGDGSGRALWRPILLWGSAAVTVVSLFFWLVLPALAGLIAEAIPGDVEHRFGARLVTGIADAVGRPSGKSPAICGDSDNYYRLQMVLDRVRPTAADGAVPLRIWVVRSPLVNAVALPGGHIVVFSGLLGFVQSGDELAGVLAHEIGHVMMRHPTRIAIERATVSAFFGLFFGDIAGGTVLGGVGSLLLGNAYSRDMERAADELGVDILRRNGLDPRALARFFERLSAEYKDQELLLGFFSTHPPSAERAAAIDSPPTEIRPIDPEHWRSVRRMCGK